MKQTVRFKTFETNSSSYHSCCILTDDEYQEYQKGNVFISKYSDRELVSKEEVMNEFEQQHFEDYFQDWLIENANPLEVEGQEQKMYVMSDEKAHTLEECKEIYRKEDMRYDFETFLSDNGYEGCDTESDYEQDHTTREVAGTKIHVLCDYGNDW
jgi:hypothetical protein